MIVILNFAFPAALMIIRFDFDIVPVLGCSVPRGVKGVKGSQGVKGSGLAL